MFDFILDGFCNLCIIKERFKNDLPAKCIEIMHNNDNPTVRDIFH